MHIHKVEYDRSGHVAEIGTCFKYMWLFDNQGQINYALYICMYVGTYVYTYYVYTYLHDLPKGPAKEAEEEIEATKPPIMLISSIGYGDGFIWSQQFRVY